MLYVTVHKLSNGRQGKSSNIKSEDSRIEYDKF